MSHECGATRDDDGRSARQYWFSTINLGVRGI